ncbi:MAG: hypothetical protein FWF90_04705 [Promicromonosporaceae bacterium]|nr:hypothetical protein [Promicromonosporaceae bacterium]
MSDPNRPYESAPEPAGGYEAQPARQPAYEPQPATRPVYQAQPAARPAYEAEPAGQPAYEPRPDVTETAPTRPERLQLDVGRYWGGALATVLVCALIGLVAWFVVDRVASEDLRNPPFGGSAAASWAVAGAIFALLAAILLNLLVVATPRPASFFGWIVAMATIILAAIPFTGRSIDLSAVLTAIVWVVLGAAVWSLLTGVLSRTVVRRARTV